MQIPWLSACPQVQPTARDSDAVATAALTRLPDDILSELSIRPVHADQFADIARRYGLDVTRVSPFRLYDQFIDFLLARDLARTADHSSLECKRRVYASVAWRMWEQEICAASAAVNRPAPIDLVFFRRKSVRDFLIAEHIMRSDALFGISHRGDKFATLTAEAMDCVNGWIAQADRNDGPDADHKIPDRAAKLLDGLLGAPAGPIDSLALAHAGRILRHSFRLSIEMQAWTILAWVQSSMLRKDSQVFLLGVLLAHLLSTALGVDRSSAGRRPGENGLPFPLELFFTSVAIHGVHAEYGRFALAPGNLIRECDARLGRRTGTASVGEYITRLEGVNLFYTVADLDQHLREFTGRTALMSRVLAGEFGSAHRGPLVRIQ